MYLFFTKIAKNAPSCGLICSLLGHATLFFVPLVCNY